MAQFRLGKAKRGRIAFEPMAFGFHHVATRETAVWLQTLGWTLEKSTCLLPADRTAIKSFLRDYHRHDHTIIIRTSEPTELVLIGPDWPNGQSPRLRIPTSLGSVGRALEALGEKARFAGKSAELSETTSLRSAPTTEHKRVQTVFYAAGKKS